MREDGKTSWWKRVEGKVIQQKGMEEAPENGKESSHSAHVNGINEYRDRSYVTNTIHKFYHRVN